MRKKHRADFDDTSLSAFQSFRRAFITPPQWVVLYLHVVTSSTCKDGQILIFIAPVNSPNKEIPHTKQKRGVAKPPKQKLTHAPISNEIILQANPNIVTTP